MTTSSSPGAATAARARVEQEILREFTTALEDFLRRTLRSATAALDSPTLVAAGIPGMKQKGDVDPFAFTNIRKHWYDVVRELAQRRDDLVPAEVESILLDSSLPSDAYTEVAEILTTSREEQWTTYKTKRALSAHLIVKEKPGTRASDPEHQTYMNRVRRLARTAATLNTSRRRVREFARDGFTHKRWVCLTPDNRVTARSVTAGARRRYEGPVVTIRTASGETSTLTPDHRVLTGRGWVAAGSLDLSDHVVKIIGSDAPEAPHVDDLPPTIGEVVDAAMASEPVEVWPVGIGMDLDVDVVEGEVEVVWTDGSLFSNVEASFPQGLRNRALPHADVLGEVAVLGRSDLGAMISTLGNALRSPTQGTNASVANLLGVPLSTQHSGLGLTSDGHLAQGQHPSDGVGRTAVLDAQRPQGQATQVVRDDLVGIEVGTWSGHVYDLSTEDGWFLSNHIITHNCHHDHRTRTTHRIANGQTVPLDSEFIVGGFPLMYPGDPTAPMEETASCRCVMIGASDPSITASATIEDMSTAAFTTMTALDADATECTPCAALAAESATEETAPKTARWAGVIGVEGEMTGDGRLIERNALEWETPIPLRYVSSDVGAHDGAQVSGRILSITRLEDGRLWGEGDFDLGTEVTREAYRQVAEDLTNGISMDLDNVAFEVRVASEMVNSEAAPQVALADEEGGGQTVATETDEDGRVTVQRISPDDEVRVTTSGRIRAATIVSIPAFSSAKIHVVEEDAVTASDAPSDLPPAPAEEDEPGEDVPLEDDEDGDLVTVIDHLVEEDDTPDPDANASEGEEFKNWVEKAGGLPRFIRRISKHLRRKGMTESHAIATAVNVVKKMCSTGDLNYPGKQSANPVSRARACAAVASWEAKRAKSKVTAGETVTYRDVPTKERKRLAEKDAAMPDGSFPIANVNDLKNAIRAIGRAKNPAAVKAHIKSRAKALDAENLIPDDWSGLGESYAATESEHQSVQGILDELPRLSDEEEDRLEGIPDAEVPNVLEGIASNEEDEERKGALMEAAGRIRNLLDSDTAPTSGGPPDSIKASGSLSSLEDKRPPAEWFTDPHLDGPTALTVTEDGRVYGHLAAWDTCHTSHTAQGQCVRPPRSATGYAYFNTGSVVTKDGEVSAGRITLGTGHADETLNPTATMAHYEDTGTAVAWVRAGEDAHGIWVAGALRSTTTSEQRETLAATPLSGDWRRIGTNLELVAALAVNVPGFPVPRPKGMVASGHMTALVASGMVVDDTSTATTATTDLSADDVAYLRRMAERARRQDAEHAEAMSKRVKASTYAMRVKRSALTTTKEK